MRVCTVMCVHVLFLYVTSFCIFVPCFSSSFSLFSYDLKFLQGKRRPQEMLWNCTAWSTNFLKLGYTEIPWMFAHVYFLQLLDNCWWFLLGPDDISLKEMSAAGALEKIMVKTGRPKIQRSSHCKSNSVRSCNAGFKLEKHTFSGRLTRLHQEESLAWFRKDNRILMDIAKKVGNSKAKV